jgi:hypothetical protein
LRRSTPRCPHRTSSRIPILEITNRTRRPSGRAAYTINSVNVSGAGSAQGIWIEEATANYFTTLGVKPFLGRLYQAGEDEGEMAHQVVVLSHAFWKSRSEFVSRLAHGRVRWWDSSSAKIFGSSIVGTILGLAITLAVTQVLTKLLYGVAPRDPVILGAVALSLALVGAVASLLPARRAATVDPLVALREE